MSIREQNWAFTGKILPEAYAEELGLKENQRHLCIVEINHEMADFWNLEDVTQMREALETVEEFLKNSVVK